MYPQGSAEVTWQTGSASPAMQPPLAASTRWSEPASYAVKMSQTRRRTTSAQNRGVVSRNDDARRRLVKKAWRGRREYGGHSTDGIGGDALDDDLRIAESAMKEINVIGRTLM